MKYPVSPEVLLRALMDPSFHEEKLQAMGAISPQVLEHARVGDIFTIRIRRSMRNDVPVPALLKKLVPQVSTLEHTDQWNARTGFGSVTIRIDGVPIQMNCQIQAIGSAHSTELAHDWELRCGVPMIGGALERFIASDLPRLMEQEAAAGRSVLGRYE